MSEALAQFVSNTQAPVWLIDESVNRLVLLLNHVIAQEPEAQNRLKRQKGRCIQLQWQDKLIQLSPTPAGLLERVSDQKFDLKLTLTDYSPFSMASAVLKGEKGDAAANTLVSGGRQICHALQKFVGRSAGTTEIHRTTP